MALATLEAASPIDASKYKFDIGKNRFYRYAIGKETRRNSHGIKLVEDPTFVSPLIGPLPESAMGRGTLEVPTKLVDRENRLLQLMSFHSAKLDGPAISSIVKVRPGIRATVHPGELPKPPELALSQELNMHANQQYAPIHPFNYSESNMSESMFLGALAGMLPSLLPAIGSIFGGLFGGGGGGGAGKAAAGGNPLQALISAISKPEAIEQITKLIGSISGGKTAAPAVVAQARAMAMSRAYGVPGYSDAMIAPLLLAALPALMPILKQVLTPETIKGIIDAPMKHTGMLINGAKDFAKLGIESHEQDLKHLRALNPGVDDPALDALLASMSLGVADMAKEITYKRVAKVRLDFANIVTATLFGRTVIPYHASEDLAFPMNLDTPNAIGKSILDLVVKRADNLKIVHRSRSHMDSVANGAVPEVPIIKKDLVAGFEPNSDYIVSVTLVWKNKQGKKRGTSMQQQITLVGDYVFDRVEESSELIPLSDPDRFRDYWHKMWQGQFTKEFKRYELQLKYYYVLKKGLGEHARLETMSKIENGERRRSGKLKSGVDLSAAALNRLIPKIRPGATPLTEAELQPLMGEDFAERFNQCARYHGKLRGRPGDTAAIWVYPEVKLQKVVLQKTGDVNANGNVISMTEHPVNFPIPAIVHFIGARTA